MAYRNPKLIHREQLRERSQVAASVLKRRKEETRISLDDKIDLAYQASVCSNHSNYIKFYDMFSMFSRGRETNDKKEFYHFLKGLAKHEMLFTNVLHEHFCCLKDLLLWKEKWVRNIEDWECKTHNVDKAYISLINHLLCEYSMPAFMYKAWLGPRGRATMLKRNRNNFVHQEWFIHMAQGGNIRKALEIPFDMTKKMTHWFSKAPETMEIEEALYWARVRGFGGDNKLARILANWFHFSIYADKDDEFWRSVIFFFINHQGMLNSSCITPLLDYIVYQKFTHGRAFVGGRIIDVDPPQPNMTMKGRSLVAMLTEMEVWHRELAREELNKKLGVAKWEPSGIQGGTFEFGTGDNKVRWVIDEILTSKELKREGSLMHHCVYSYSSSCADGRYAVFSLKKDTGYDVSREATIGVNMASTFPFIEQARGKYNKYLSSDVNRILSLWAKKNDLKISSYL